MGLVREIQVDLSAPATMTSTALFDALDMDTDALFDFEEDPLGDPLFDDSDRFILLEHGGYPPKLKVDIEEVLNVLAVSRDVDESEAEDVAEPEGLEVIEQLGDDLLQALESFSAAPKPVFAVGAGMRRPSALELSGAVIIRNQGARSAAEARAKQLKERHNANERRRTNAARDRIREMRDQVNALELQREKLSASSTQPPKSVAAPLSQDIAVPLNPGCGIPSESAYLELVTAVDALRKEKTYLKERIDVYDAQHSVVQSFLTEVSLAIDGKPVAASATGVGAVGVGQDSQRVTAQRKKRSKKKNGSDSDDAIDDNSSDSDDSSSAWAEPTPTYLKVLFETPLTTDQAFGWVKQSYDEIIALKNHSRFESTGSPTFGWSDRRVMKADSLQFMFNQDFRGALASEFVYKTWNLLTVLKSYKLIQPRTTGLRVLQRINDDCVVVRLSVASTQEDVFHTIMVVARGRIDNGYLISYRSIPLSEGQTHFTETEGTYVSVFNWFMFIDKFDQDDRPVCEVIFGGRVANRSATYLRYLTMEVVAGIVRWQTAVGQSRFSLSL